MPYHSLEGLAVRRDGLRIDRGDDDAGIGDSRGEAAVATNNADDGRTDRTPVLERPYQIRADVLLETAAANREHDECIVAAQAAALQPFDEDRVPALVVGARREFRDVIGGR